MKTICQFTSLPLEIPFLSSPTRVQFYHPIFTLSLKSLLGIYADWKSKPASFHSEAEVILLTTAFLKASTLVHFKSSINPKTISHPALLQSLEPLIETVCLVAANLKNPEFETPSFIISADTSSLDCLPQWISLWQESLQNLNQSSALRQSIAHRNHLESRLSYYIRHQKTTPIYLTLLKDWITLAADLPTFQVFNPLTGKDSPISEYWLEILSRSIKENQIFSLPLNDVQEFYDHLIESLDDVGSDFANVTLTALRKTITAQTQGFGIDSTYVIVQSPEKEAIAKANTALLSAIASKYSSKPERKDFSTQTEYLRASLAWAAQNMKAEGRSN